MCTWAGDLSATFGAAIRISAVKKQRKECSVKKLMDEQWCMQCGWRMQDGDVAFRSICFASFFCLKLYFFSWFSFGAKIFDYTKNDKGLDGSLERETEGSLSTSTSCPGVSHLNGPQHEKR